MATRANIQPAFGCYRLDRHAAIARPLVLIVLALEGDGISTLTVFVNPSLFPRFGLPRSIDT